MNKMLRVAQNDLRITFQDHTVWINLVIIPVILILILGAVQGAFIGDENDKVLIDVYVRDDSELATQFLSELRAINPNILLCPMDSTISIPDDDDPCKLGDLDTLDLSASFTRVEDGDIEGIVQIPAGFGAKVLSGQPVNVIYQSDDPFNQPSALAQSVQAAVGRISGASVASRVGVDVYESNFDVASDDQRAAFEQAVYSEAAQLWTNPPATVRYQTTASDDGDSVNGFNQAVPGMGTMYVLFTVMGGALLLLQERQNSTFQRLMTMPVSRAQLLGGKALARFTMGMLQYAVAFGVGFALGVNFGDSFIGLILLMVAFVICVTALTFLFGTFVTTEQQAGSVSTLIALTLAPLGGAWWPLEIVPDFMQKIGHISPVAWVMDGFTELSFRNGTFSDVIIPVLVLLAMAAAMFLLSITRFKYD
jgi:ABC-2 type transport system permease protein